MKPKVKYPILPFLPKGMWCLITVYNRTPVAKPIKENSSQRGMVFHNNAKTAPMTVELDMNRAFFLVGWEAIGKVLARVKVRIGMKARIPSRGLPL